MPDNNTAELLMKILEKRDEAKKYMESYSKLMRECDKMILELKFNSDWEVE
tara:strand:+ start:2315 stop:2467 length:153 start_codon:yes stop_codon:yes gene_type:complete